MLADFPRKQRPHGPVFILGDLNARIHLRNDSCDVVGPYVFGDRGAALNCHILHNWAELEDSGVDPVAITEARFLTDLHDLEPSDKTDKQASDE